MLDFTLMIVNACAFVLLAFCLWFSVMVILGCQSSRKPWKTSVVPDSKADCANTQIMAVLIPAHNEEAGLPLTLESVKANLAPGDYVVVVADNCADGTADVARAAGVKVVERQHDTLRGKGFALAFGRDHLKQDAPDIVTVVDADCRLEPGSLHALKAHVTETGRSGQALYLLETLEVDTASIGERVSTFALRIKNYLRARGLSKLGLPVQLSGSGMVFPFADFERLNLSTGHLAEDLYFGLLLAGEGRGAKFVESAFVRSALPSADGAAASQRTRWVHGHVQVMTYLAPKVMVSSLMRLRLSAFLLAFDAMVPPLVPLLALTILTVLSSLGLSYVPDGSFHPFGGAGLGILSLVALSLVLAWLSVGRDVIKARDLTKIAILFPARIGAMVGAIFKPERRWVRTARDEEKDSQN